MVQMRGSMSIDQATSTKKSNGAELLVRTLLELDVRHAFNIPGIGMFPLLEAFHKHKSRITYVSSLNEKSLALIAHGYARATREPAFINVYHASGTALAMMALTTAWADRVPLVLTTTTSSRQLSGRDQYAAVPRSVTEMTHQFTKWSHEVQLPERIPEALVRAFTIAASPPMGPVHLAFPMDLYSAETDGTAITERERLCPYTSSTADEEGLRLAAELLLTAETPLIIAGGEVGQYEATAELVELAEFLGCPVVSEPYTAYLGFPTAHEQYLGKLPANRTLVEQSDVVFTIGAEFTESGLGPPPKPVPSSKLIFLASDPLEMGKQVWADVGLTGHPKPTIRKLTSMLREMGIDQETAERRHKDIGHRRNDKRAEAERMRVDGWEDAPLKLGRVVHEIKIASKDEAIIVNQGGATAGHLDTLYEFSDPSLYYGISGKASAQGWGCPVSIGVQLARPDKRVVAFLGDGGFMFSATSIYTAAKWNLPVIFVVLNNGGWKDVTSLSRLSGGSAYESESEFGWDFTEPPIRYADFAASLGLQAYVAEDGPSLAVSLEQAFSSGSPSLVEVMVDPGEVDAFFSAASQ